MGKPPHLPPCPLPLPRCGRGRGDYTPHLPPWPPFRSYTRRGRGDYTPHLPPGPPSAPTRGEEGGDERSRGDLTTQITPLPQRGRGAGGEGDPQRGSGARGEGDPLTFPSLLSRLPLPPLIYPVSGCQPHSASSAKSAWVSTPAAAARASRSGRRVSVRRSRSTRRQRAISPWLPERSTDGTASPSHTAGRV